MNRRVKSFFFIKTNIISSSTRQHNPRHTRNYSKRRRLREAPASRGPGLRGRHGRRIMMMALMVIATAAGSAVFWPRCIFEKRSRSTKEARTAEDRRRRTDYEEPHYKWYVGRGAAGRTGQEER